jgi:hypothetical protein
MAKDNLPAKPSSARAIDTFLNRAAKLPTLAQAKGRLIFAIDATMSRQPTWNRATEIQSDMFQMAQGIGGLAVQLVYFRLDGVGERAGQSHARRDVPQRLHAALPCADACRGGGAADEGRRTGLCR